MRADHMTCRLHTHSTSMWKKPLSQCGVCALGNDKAINEEAFIVRILGVDWFDVVEVEERVEGDDFEKRVLKERRVCVMSHCNV